MIITIINMIIITISRSTCKSDLASRDRFVMEGINVDTFTLGRATTRQCHLFSKGACTVQVRTSNDEGRPCIEYFVSLPPYPDIYYTWSSQCCCQCDGALFVRCIKQIKVDRIRFPWGHSGQGGQINVGRIVCLVIRPLLQPFSWETKHSNQEVFLPCFWCSDYLLESR